MQLCVALRGIFNMQQIKQDEPVIAANPERGSSSNAASHLLVRRNYMLRGWVALDPCSGCLHDGGAASRVPICREG